MRLHPNVIIFSFVALLFGCKSTTTEPTKTPAEILVTNAWKIDRLASKDNNKTLTTADVGSQASALYLLDYTFKDNNIVRAADRVSKQIVNTGTWYLEDSNQSINIDIEGFKGLFQVVEMSKSKMVLSVKGNVKIAGVDSTVNMEFVPSL